jgi:hypothetical protein
MKIEIETGDVKGFIENLRKQKRWLLSKEDDEAEGLVNLLDHIQDTLTDVHGLPQDAVFDFEGDYQTTCPNCGKDGCLFVVEANGKEMESLLHSDGFEVPDHVCDGNDRSTEDEKARCCNCGKGFDLSDLMV